MFQRHCPTDRIITHYYYPSWPDRGVPTGPSSLCAFTEHVRQHLEAIPRLGPAVIHCRSDLWLSAHQPLLQDTHYSLMLRMCPFQCQSCRGFRGVLIRYCTRRLEVNPVFMCFSAGIGRSGTFATLLWLMQLCVRGIQPDVRAAVEDLRLHRMWMVQNLVSPALTLTCSSGGLT